MSRTISIGAQDYASFIASGIPEDRILKYGFAFQGKKCLIKKKM